MPLSTQLAEKSLQAAIAAIEIYNKPNFSYREESFALLMTNAWELLLKEKWLRDRGEVIDTLYEMVKDDAGQSKPKVNRSGNPISHGLTYLAGSDGSGEEFLSANRVPPEPLGARRDQG